MWFVALKNKESSHDDNEGKSAFQTISIELYKQNKKQKKEHLRSVTKVDWEKLRQSFVKLIQ